MIKKIYFFILCALLIPKLIGCAGVNSTYVHYINGMIYDNAGKYNEAIIEYEKGLSIKSGPVVFKMSILNNLGLVYQRLDNFEKAAEYFHKSIEVLPDRGYYGYWNLASLYYKNGMVKQAYEYSLKAKRLVDSPRYYELEKDSAFNIDVVKNGVLSGNEFYQLRLLFQELINEYELKNYKRTVQIAEQILNKKYYAYFVAGLENNTIWIIEEGSLADVNGLVKGDKILEIDGVQVSNVVDAYNEAAKLYYKYGNVVSIKIERKGRVIEVACKLIYPEIEKTRLILQETQGKVAAAAGEREREDTQPPWVKILEPKFVEGIKVTTDNDVTFVILASDNIAVKDVKVNGVSCTSSEVNKLEKTFLPGEVKKYNTTMPLLREAINRFTVTAIDTNGNITEQKIEIHNKRPAVSTFKDAFEQGLQEKKVEKIYDHRVAVVIGINRYNPWPGLEFAVNDAKSIRDQLTKMGYDKIIELYDREATRARIMRILADELPGIMGKNDALMVYFAGHGATEDLSDSSQEGYIIPVDGDVTNYRGTAISMTYIHEMIKKYRAKHILFIFDSCYSGLGLKRGGGTTKRASGFIRLMAQKHVTQIITAGGKGEQAAEGKGHGVFTKALLDALEGKDGLNQDGYILASDIGQMLRKKVGEKTNFRQTPLFGWLAGEGDFIFESF